MHPGTCSPASRLLTLQALKQDLETAHRENANLRVFLARSGIPVPAPQFMAMAPQLQQAMQPIPPSQHAPQHQAQQQQHHAFVAPAAHQSYPSMPPQQHIVTTPHHHHSVAAPAPAPADVPMQGPSHRPSTATSNNTEMSTDFTLSPQNPFSPRPPVLEIPSVPNPDTIFAAPGPGATSIPSPQSQGALYTMAPASVGDAADGSSPRNHDLDRVLGRTGPARVIAGPRPRVTPTHREIVSLPLRDEGSTASGYSQPPQQHQEQHQPHQSPMDAAGADQFYRAHAAAAAAVASMSLSDGSKAPASLPSPVPSGSSPMAQTSYIHHQQPVASSTATTYPPPPVPPMPQRVSKCLS